MVEVFKTNVDCEKQAGIIIDHIQSIFSGCRANFDLEDCDRILRVKSADPIEAILLIMLLKIHGFEAEILSDEIPLVAR
jgi:hypothetical protein